MKYPRIWFRVAIMSFWVQAASPLSSFGYLVGKLVRISFFFIFLIAIFHHTQALAGYSFDEAALFFLTFNLVDILAQLFFRGIYGIRSLIREGDFDYYLIQPANALYRVAFSTVDFLDVVTVFPVVIMTWRVMRHIPGAFQAAHFLLYCLLTFNGLLIAFAIHVAVASLAVWTQELDNTIWIYRDLMSLGRFPSDIYAGTMRLILTFAFPIAVMVSFPPKALLGRLPGPSIGMAFVIAFASLFLSLRFWKFSQKSYTSVSS